MLQVTSPADLPGAIVAAEQAGAPGLAHLLRALNAGRIAFLPVLPDCSNGMFKQFVNLTSGRPAVVLIGDDDYQERGPAGFTIAERAVRWASSIVLHAAGAETSQYESVIHAAQIVKRMLLIECSTQTAQAWKTLITSLPDPPPTAVIWPREGQHPIAPSRREIQ